jgi:uncharacterized membrane protein (DUF373 family)
MRIFVIVCPFGLHRVVDHETDAATEFVTSTDGLNNVHAPHPDLDEPLMAQQSESEGDEERQRLADRVLGRLEDAVYWGIALVLIIGSAALLISQFNTLLTMRKEPAKIVMLEILDGLLLIFIFVELLYAVRACLRSHEIVAEPFLIVGILAGIKEIVVLSVEAATLLEKGPAFSRAVVEIGVLAGVVLALALAAFVLRERRRDTVDAGERAGDEEQEEQPAKS